MAQLSHSITVPGSNRIAGKKVALITNDVNSRDSLAEFLRGLRLNLHVFDSSAIAQKYLTEHTVDAVLTDLRMPEIGGLDLLQFVNELESPAPVILMSGIGNVSDVAQALRLGAADYLIKPILDYEVVLHALERAFDLQALKQENEAYRQRLERANREMNEHLQLLERDQEAAKHVQRNLLPLTPVNHQGVELSHLVLPSLYLSGDFVDYGCLHRRFVAFYLTDVSGHGASSAFVTVWFKQLVRRLFRERQLFQDIEDFEQAPAELLEMVNNEFMQSRFFSHLTCIVGLIDTQTQKMFYVLAGHLPLPVLVGADGEAQFLPGKGKPLGLFKGAKWQVNQVSLPDGFRLILFSDGVLEVMPGENLIEKEQALLGYLQNLPFGAKVENIVDRLGIDRDKEAPDDIAVMLAKMAAPE